MLKDFYVDNTTVVKVPMMFRSGDFPYSSDSELGCMVVKLEYEGNGAAFFILPDRNKMDTVVQALSRDIFYQWDTFMINSNLDLYIPKLSLSGSCDFSDIMRAMHLTHEHEFQTEPHNVTSAIWQTTKMIHMANLQLSEDGEKPALSSDSPSTVARKDPTLNFNRPFIILVFDYTSWSVLFLGKVVNPQEHMTM